MPEATKETGTAIPGESGGSSQNPTVQEQRQAAIVEKATSLGWKPEEEWQGDAADWVDAKEFLGRQTLFDKIHSLKSENKKLGADLEVIKNYVQQMSKVEYDKALRTLQAQRREAIKEADVDTAEQLDKDIQTLQTQRQQTPPAQNGPPAEFEPWLKENQWYKNDPDLREEADAIGAAYVYRNNSRGVKVEPIDALRHVADRIKRMYPEKFEQQTTKKQSAPVVEEGGASGGGAPRKGKFTEANLSDQERTVMNALVKRGVVTKEKYLADIAAAYAR